jgi:hypothetical protein
MKEGSMFRNRSVLASLTAVLLAALLPLTAIGSSTGNFTGSGQGTFVGDAFVAPFTGTVLKQPVSGYFHPLTFPITPSGQCVSGPASNELDFDSGASIILSGRTTNCTTPQLFTANGTFTITSATGIYSGASGSAKFSASASGPEHSSGVLYFSWNGSITLP